MSALPKVSAVSPRLSFAFGLMAALLASSPAQATDPVVADYMLSCQGCHLPDGSGFPAHGVPSLKGYMGNFLRVEGGREFLLRVPGVTQSELSDARLAQVMNWTLSTFSANETPTNTTPFTAAEVARWRRQPLVDVKGTRAQLVQRIERAARQAAKPS